VSTTDWNPVRYPDVRSRPLMTRRAWWLVVLNVLLPGSAQILAGSKRLGRVGLVATLVSWILVIAAVLVVSLAPTWVIVAATQPVMIGVGVVILTFYAVLWLALTLDTLRMVKLVKVEPTARVAVAILAILALVASSGTAVYAASTGVTAITVLQEIFAAEALLDEPIDGRYNILLIGGDAGKDREGLRADSITVASVDAETGQVTLIGVPRNLGITEFVAGSPMIELYPNGYDCGVDCLISYLTYYGNQHPELYADAEANHSSAGIEALRDGVEGTLGMTIPYYALVDMRGFEKLIDALGGIDITVAEDVPIGANTYDDGTPAPAIGVIEAGEQHMDGETALWYARSRYGTTDYERMERQRQVQEAILAQADPLTVLLRFQEIAAAGKNAVATDIPQNLLGYFAQHVVDAREQPITRLDIVPPDFDPDNPDLDAVRAAVAELLAPVAEEPQS